MSIPERIHRGAAIVLGLWSLSWQACAQPAWMDNPTNSSTLRVSLKSEEFRGGLNGSQVQRVYLTLGTNQFALAVPEGYRADASNPRKIVLSDFNYTSFITWRFIGAAPAGSDAFQDAFYRNLALNLFPGAIVTDQFSQGAASHMGPAFELRWRNSFGAEEIACVAFIPTAAGVMQFDLLASSSNFNAGRYTFRVLLSTLCSNEKGKLKITPVPGQS